MASVPVHKTTATLPAESIEERFRKLEATWTAETGYLSSYTDIVEHPAFREIIRDERPRLWGWALPEITGADPVAPQDGGNIAKMTEAWLRWGKANGYRW